MRLGALECLGSITKGHDWSREGESLLYRLATSRRQRLVRLLLRLLLEYGARGGGPRAVSSKAEDDVYGLACAILSVFCLSSPDALSELCDALPAAEVRILTCASISIRFEFDFNSILIRF